MSVLPPLDLHAHLDPSISTRDLDDLQAVVFAVTRSISEAQIALSRRDSDTIWGVGCHPGLANARHSFDADEFSRLLDRTALAGELGLDGSRPSLDEQRVMLVEALEALSKKPRIVSLHSYRATGELLDVLDAHPIKGAVLHWWLGDGEQTARAVDLGCYFSVNSSGIGKRSLLESVPPERLLTETDHPFGDRRSNGPRRPGATEDVENEIARVHGLKALEVRRLVWTNLLHLVSAVDCYVLLPAGIRARLAVMTDPHD